jgi:hypothetical protein
MPFPGHDGHGRSQHLREIAHEAAADSRDALWALTEIERRRRPGGAMSDPLLRRASTYGLSAPRSRGAPSCHQSVRSPWSGHVAQGASGQFDPGAAAAQPAELPQLARGAVVLMDDVVDGEGVELTGAEAIDCLGDALDELAEARLVVGGHQRSVGLALTLRTHVGIVAPGGMNLSSRARAREGPRRPLQRGTPLPLGMARLPCASARRMRSPRAAVSPSSQAILVVLPNWGWRPRAGYSYRRFWGLGR